MGFCLFDNVAVAAAHALAAAKYFTGSEAAYAAAMMALFLVLWLVNSTNRETRQTVAQYFNPIKLSDSISEVTRSPLLGEHTDEILAKVLGYKPAEVAAIKANRNRPFFMYLAYNAPHTPLQATKADYDALAQIRDHTQRVYGAMIRQLDYLAGFWPEVNVQHVFDAKMVYNATRQDHTHEARKIAGGKQF